MNIENINGLSNSLQGLGFNNNIIQQLIKNMILKRQKFIIHQRISWGNDVVNFHLTFESDSDVGTYCCTYYDAVLRKEIEIPDARVNEIEIMELDKRMTQINWMKLFEDAENKKLKIEDNGNWLEEEKVEHIVTDLQLLESSEEGKEICGLLKVKHWCDTPLEELFSDLMLSRNRFEINQRFYFLNGQSGISVEEAYRFLHNRWIEKRFLTKKKEIDNSKVNANEKSKDSSGKGLLQRKTKNKKSV